MNIKLTNKQAEALLWAIELTKASYDGWTREEMGEDTVSDLSALKRVYDKLCVQQLVIRWSSEEVTA